MPRLILARLALMPALFLLLIISLGLTQGTEIAEEAVVSAPIPTPENVGTAFTFQGHLIHDSAPVNDVCDFEFRLFDVHTGGSQIGPMLAMSKEVTDGLFTVQLDFGSAADGGPLAFRGEERWLEISTSCTNTGPSGTLSPRQALTAAPYALSLRPEAVISDEDSSVQLNRAWEPPPGGLTYKAGVYAEADGPASFDYGVYGSGPSAGIVGYSENTSGYGVYGKAGATSGPAYGVVGVSESPEGAGVYARAAGEHDPDLILGDTSSSNDNGVIFSDMAYPGSDIFIRSNDDVGIHLDRNNDEAGHFYVYRGDGTWIMHLDEQGGMQLQDDEGKVVFEVNEAGGAQFNTGAPGLRVNTVPVPGQALPPQDNIITALENTVGESTGTSVTIGVDGLGLIVFNNGGNLKVAHCSDVTCTSATISLLDTGSDPSVAIGADGLGLISYESDGNLKVAHCDDIICTGATISTLGSGGGSSVAIGADGLGLISYFSDYNVKVAHCGNVTCTGATISTLDSGGYSSLAIGIDGLGLISYTSGGNLKVAHCGGVTCTDATISTVDSSGIVKRDLDMTIGADGMGLISYQDVTGLPPERYTSLKIAHCSNVVCTSADTAVLYQSLLSLTGSPGTTSVTVGADGLGLISFYDPYYTRLDFKVAHCSNVSCQNAVIFTPASQGNDGKTNSVTIGADGLPLIAYTDVLYYPDPQGHLMVLHCASPF